MTYTNVSNDIKEAVKRLQGLNADDQLAVLWLVYTDMKDRITPTPAPSAGLEISQAIVNRIQDMSREDQLQAQRDIISGAATEVTQQYQALNERAKLGVWYLLAQGMEKGTIVPMPSDYQLSSEAQQFLNTVKGLNFEQQTNFMISAASRMGS